MKVLVYFTQEYISEDPPIIRMKETFAHVIEASSNRDLLAQFKKLEFVPKYLNYILGKNIRCGKREMHWYLPESNQPHIEDI